MTEAFSRIPGYDGAMVDGNAMAAVAALVGDPARANMLAAMFDGRAHTAGELAALAGVAAPTASGHLARLLAGGLVTCLAQGRHRYYRLASTDVAMMLEAISGFAPPISRSARATPRVPPEMRNARTCYDHLAGRLGVAIADTLVAGGALTPDVAAVEQHDHPLFAALGIAIDGLGATSRRPLCRACIDWTERRPHIAGSLGAAILERLVERSWLRRDPGNRVVRITPLGTRELARRLGIRLEDDSVAAAA